MLTGKPESLNLPKFSNSTELSEEEQTLMRSSQMAINEILNLSQVSPAPVPLQEFCLQPENIDLSGVCK